MPSGATFGAFLGNFFGSNKVYVLNCHPGLQLRALELLRDHARARLLPAPREGHAEAGVGQQQRVPPQVRAEHVTMRVKREIVDETAKVELQPQVRRGRAHGDEGHGARRRRRPHRQRRGHRERDSEGE